MMRLSVVSRDTPCLFLRLAIMYLMAYACLYVRKNNEKGVQHETIGYLREPVKRGGYYS